MQIISIKEAGKRVGLCRSTLWQLTRDGKFPQPIQITPKRKGYVASEVDGWIQARIAERDGAERAA